MRKRRALITGGAGLIGSALARRLHALGWETAVLDAFIEGHGGNRFNLRGLEDAVELVEGDACDERLVSRLAAGRDVVFHVAGQRSHSESMRAPAEDLRLNCAAALSVLEAVRREAPKARLIYTSTRQVYGVPKSLPVAEDHPTIPVDVNGAHKLAVEHYLSVYHRAYGLRTCSLRLTNTYGPGMRVADAKQGFLGLWIRRLLEGEPLTVFGDGTQRRDFNFVDDVVDALLLCADTPAAEGETLNLGAPDSHALLETARLLISIRGSGRAACVPFPAEARAVDIGDYAADFSKAERLLGWRPRVSLADGLSRTVAYYAEHLPRYRLELSGARA